MNNDSYEKQSKHIIRKNKVWRSKTVKKTYKIEVDCAACALKMEDATKKVEGVANATVSFMTQKMNVEFNEGADVKETMDKEVKACKKVESDCEIYL